MRSSLENTNSCTSQKSSLDRVSSSHGSGHCVGCASGHDWDLKETFLSVGIEFLSGGIKFLNFEGLQDLNEFLLGINNSDNERVLRVGVFLDGFVLASVDAIGGFEEFLGKLCD